MTTPGLFAEFDKVSQEQWLAATERSLRGRTLESLITRNAEGIEIHPLTSADDSSELSHIDALPGQFPFARGTEAAGYHGRPWLIAQEIEIADPADFNRALKDALANGQTAIILSEENRFHGEEAFSAAFADIDLAQTPILQAGDESVVSTYRLLKSRLGAEKMSTLEGCLGFDPVHGLAKRGRMNDDAFDQLAAYVRAAQGSSPALHTIAVSSEIYHEAGCSAVQELAVIAATAVEYLRQLVERGLDINAVATGMHCFLCIGEDFFMSVAKLRATRVIWAQVVRAFGGDQSAQRVRLHASGGKRNKTRLDPHVNMLRATSEALAAAIGGVDSLSLPPFDAPLGQADGFSRRIARNIQLILQEELQLTGLIDPAGGSWHVERLTDQLARAAWKRFQEIEADGGMLACLQSGRIQADIEAVAARRQRDLERGDAILVGANKFAKSDEALSITPVQRANVTEAAQTADGISARPLPARRWGAPFEAELVPSERNP